MHKPNNVLEHDVREELRYDAGLDDTRITVSTDDGLVVLTGAVPTLAEVGRATRDAGAVAGVKTVENRLLVGPSGAAMADEDIARNCAAALDAERLVPDRSISVAVKDGRAVLKGHLRHHFERKAAHHAIARVEGVLGIDDQIAPSVASPCRRT